MYFRFDSMIAVPPFLHKKHLTNFHSTNELSYEVGNVNIEPMLMRAHENIKISRMKIHYVCIYSRFGSMIAVPPFYIIDI